MIYKKSICCMICLCILSIATFPNQNKKRSDEEITLGITYQHFFYLNNNTEYLFRFFDIGGVMVFPLAHIKPLLSAGVFFCQEKDTVSEYTWTHKNLYAKAGIQYIHHVNKTFHAGASIAGGFTWASLQFPAGMRSLYNLMADAEFFLRFKSLKNISITLHPAVRYYHSLTRVKQFNGFHAAIGCSLCYHINMDKPRKKHELRIFEIQTDPIFAALKNYYPENQAGWITIENTSQTIVKDIKISLGQSEYIDLPTPSRNIFDLLPGEKQRIKIFAVFNDKILSIQGMKPLSCEITVMYQVGNNTKEFKETVVFQCYDKNSLIWDDDRKIAGFINPVDSVIKDFTGTIRNQTHAHEIENFSKPLQMGMLFYTALTQAGCFYQPDPNTAPLYLNGMKVIIDTINYPRETLKQLNGDCDDLTVLFLTLLESVGVETGFITIPGHILPVFNTGLKTQKYKLLHPEKEMLISINNNLWIPIEITCIGKDTFLSAWQKGIKRWDESKDQRKIYTTKSAQYIYKPLVFQETEQDVSWNIDKKLGEEFTYHLNELTELIVKDHLLTAEESGSKQDFTNLGMMYACFNKHTSAEKAFLKALEIDPSYMYAQYNLGSSYFIQGMYTDALAMYNQLLTVISKDNKLYKNLLMQISNTYYRLKDYENAYTFDNLLSALPGKPDETFKITTLEQGSSEDTYTFNFYFVTEEMEEKNDSM